MLDYGKAWLREADNDTQNALLTVMLALRAYKAEHGSYPNRLDALAPHYLAHVPDDPFALSTPLRYRRLGKTFLLYSVGPDGKDDGGKPIFDAAKGGPRPSLHDARYFVYPDSKGDIVPVNE